MKLRFNVCENFHPYAHRRGKLWKAEKHTFPVHRALSSEGNGEKLLFKSFETFIGAVEATLRYLSTILSLFSYLEQCI